MAMPVLTREEAKEIIERMSQKKGFFQFDTPIFVKGRTDICALIRHEENGTDSLFLIWKDWEKQLRVLRIGSYQTKKGFLEIKEIIKTRTQVVIEVYHKNHRFGSFWIPLRILNLRDSFN